MTGQGSSQDDQDYTMMQAALSETARGRWFLLEHARRHRGHDTQILLDAIGRIGAVVAARPAEPAHSTQDGAKPSQEFSTPSKELAEVASLVARIRQALTGVPEGYSSQDCLPDLGRAATSDVLDATERIQEAAWTLRERGADPAICDLLDQRATEIYAACAVQDGLAQRSATALELLHDLDHRLTGGRNAAEPDVVMAPVRTLPVRTASAAVKPRTPDPAEEAAAWPLTPPTHDQEEADEPNPRRPAPAAPVVIRAPAEPYPATLDALDALDAREKLRLLT